MGDSPSDDKKIIRWEGRSLYNQQKCVLAQLSSRLISMKTTRYFDAFASRKHPEVQREWIERVLGNPVKTEVQPNQRIALWGNIEEADNRVLRVITLEDGETVHNAFFDRNFYKRQQRGDEPQ